MHFFLVCTKSLHNKTRLTRGYLIHIQNFTSQLSKSAIDMSPWFIFVEESECGGGLFSDFLWPKTKALYSHLHPSTSPPQKPNAPVRIYPANFFPQFHTRKKVFFLLQLTELEDIKNGILEKYVVAIQGFYRAYRYRKKFLQIRKGSLASRRTVLLHLYLLFRFD